MSTVLVIFVVSFVVLLLIIGIGHRLATSRWSLVILKVLFWATGVVVIATGAIGFCALSYDFLSSRGVTDNDIFRFGGLVALFVAAIAATKVDLKRN